MTSNPQLMRELYFQSQVYTLVVLKKAAYRLSDRCSFEFEVNEAGTLCRLLFPEGTLSETIDVAIRDFQREVLDQDLRQTVAAETESVRNVILSHAFSRTGLQAK